MIVEKATVIGVEEGWLTVETIQQSTCGSCSAQKGCGQGVLAKYLSHRSFFKLNLEEFQRKEFKVGDVVELGIDELALVRASVWLYILPLVGLLLGVYLGALVSEGMSILGALLGLLFAAYLSSYHARQVKYSPEYAPVLIEGAASTPVSKASAIRFVSAENPVEHSSFEA